MSEPTFRLERFDSPREIKWCLFVNNKRGSIGKLILELLPISGSNDIQPHIKSIFVKEQYRGNKLGSILLITCLGELVILGARSVQLEAEEESSRHGKLVAWYQHFNFTLIDQETTNSKRTSQLKYNGDQVFRVERMVCVPDQQFIAHWQQFQFQTMELIMELRDECINQSRWSGTLEECLWRCEELKPGTMAKSLGAMKYLREAGQPEFIQLAGVCTYLSALLGNLEWKCKLTQSGVCDEPTKHRLPSWACGELFESWVVGCSIPESIRDSDMFVLNPDSSNTSFGGTRGCYDSHCGLSNVVLNWSPWEYLYQILRVANSDQLSLPVELLYIIRYRRCLAWSQTNAYNDLEDSQDEDAKELVVEVTQLLDEFENSFLEDDEESSNPAATSCHLSCGEVSKVEGSSRFQHELESCRDLIAKFAPGILRW